MSSLEKKPSQIKKKKREREKKNNKKKKKKIKKKKKERKKGTKSFAAKSNKMAKYTSRIIKRNRANTQKHACLTTSQG